MGLIRVNPDGLKQGASEIEQVAEAYRRLADRALRVGQSAPSYDGQFGPRVQAAGDEANARLNGLAGRLTELSQKLAQIAEAFETADAQAIAGLLGLAATLHSLFGSNLSGLTLSLLRPSHISESVWNALPLEDRLAILEGLGIFVSGTGPAAGTVLHVLNPLRVRREPGLNGEIGAYARPGSDVAYTGLSRTADGIEWYQVRYEDPVKGLVIGWVSSYFLSTGVSRVGFEPEKVRQLYLVQTNTEVRGSGGSLMSITSDYLQIRDGPTGDYAVVDAPEWGRVVRWTGNYIEEGGHTWYEVLYDDDTRGWARGDRVEEYAPPPGAPPAGDGSIWVPLQQERSFSYYTVTDVDGYQPATNAPDHFDNAYQVRWANDIGPNLEADYGALFSAEGVAMQGSGKVTIESIDPITGSRNEETLYFELDNGTELDWVNGDGHPTEWKNNHWSNGQPVQIGNPEDARFRPVSKAPDLTSGVSLAGPPSLRGQTIWVPELAGFSDYNREGMFTVEDAGGAFPEGSTRFDVFFENPEEGIDWYDRASGVRLGTSAFVQQEIPPELEESPSP